MATKQLNHVQSKVLAEFQPLEPFELDIPQKGGKPIRQPYKVGVIYYIRSGNAFLYYAVLGDGGLAEQGKVAVRMY